MIDVLNMAFNSVSWLVRCHLNRSHAKRTFMVYSAVTPVSTEDHHGFLTICDYKMEGIAYFFNVWVWLSNWHQAFGAPFPAGFNSGKSQGGPKWGRLTPFTKPPQLWTTCLSKAGYSPANVKVILFRYQISKIKTYIKHTFKTATKRWDLRDTSAQIILQLYFLVHCLNHWPGRY